MEVSSIPWIIWTGDAEDDLEENADTEAGAYAEYLVSSTKMLIHKPKELSWQIAAGIPEVSFPYRFSLHYYISSHIQCRHG